MNANEQTVSVIILSVHERGAKNPVGVDPSMLERFVFTANAVETGEVGLESP